MPSSSTSPLHLALCCVTLLSLHFCAAVPTTKVGFGYRLVSIEENRNRGGLIGHLQLKRSTSAYGPDIPHLRLFVKHETKDRLRVHITDAEEGRWEVPYNLLPREQPPPLGSKASTTPFTASEYAGDELIFSYTSDPFTFVVKRKANGQTLFDSSCGTIVFKDQYLEISTHLPKTASLYGLGENTQPGGIRLRPSDPYTLYTTDISAINLNSDLYGSHPVYMDLMMG